MSTLLRRACGMQRYFTKASGHNKALSTAAANDEWLTVKDDSTSGVAIVEMNRAPVNSLNLEFLTQLNIAFEKLAAERECRGAVLTSGIANIFSAGLDITEMYRCRAERAAEFWRALQSLWLTLYGSRLVTIAAINGHAPAGGCLLATCCDHRAMLTGNGGYRIGLNETLLGIVAPFWFKDSMQNVVGHRATERSIQLGTLYDAGQAADLGLVDQVCASQDELDTHVREEMARWLAIPDAARILSKQMMRQATLDAMQRGRDQDVTNFVNFCMKESVQANLGAYLEGLQKKRKAKT